MKPDRRAGVPFQGGTRGLGPSLGSSLGPSLGPSLGAAGTLTSGAAGTLTSVAVLLALFGCAPGGAQEGAQGTNAAGSADAAQGVAGSAGMVARSAVLSEQEVRDGWRLLFDGSTLTGWRGYRMDGPPPAWSAVDGTLHFRPGSQGGDLITIERFRDFELRLEWRIEQGGNSGIFFHVVEDYDWAYESGPEMQVLDDTGHRDGENPLTSNASNFALHAPVNPPLRPVGEWNDVMIRVRGPSVEHWLNGARVVQYELWTDEWQALVAGSKFVEMPGYGLARDGHIGLQDHGDPVWFRNVRVRTLP